MMKRSLFALSVLAAVSMTAVPAHAQQVRAKGIESPGYVWNTPDPELNRALDYKASAKRGKVAYKICKGCHLPDGTGKADALYPQLAGQHPTVMLKQMMDIRAGRRDNPKMAPFVGDWIVTAEELADISAYLKTLPPPSTTARGTVPPWPRARPCTTRTARSVTARTARATPRSSIPWWPTSTTAICCGKPGTAATRVGATPVPRWSRC